MTSKRTPIPKEQSILTDDDFSDSTQQGRAEALTLADTVPKEFEDDSTLIEEWLVKTQGVKPADAAAIFVEMLTVASTYDYDGHTPAKIEWTCKQCGTNHEEKPTLRKGLCPDCDDYED